MSTDGGSAPGGGEADGILSRLFERRVVLAHGRLDNELANNVTAQLLTLDAEGGEPIELVIDCPDADLDPAFALLDVCESLTAPLTVVVSGRLTGAGLALLAGHHRRLGRPHATIRLAEPHFEPAHGSADSMARLVDEQRRQVGVLIERIAQRTSRPDVLIADDMARGLFLTSEQAVAYGLLDDVASRAAR